MTSIVIAEDHQLVRQGLRALLSRIDSYNILGEAEDGEEALELIKKTRPDVVLTDVVMPKMNGLELTEAVYKELPSTKVLVLSMYDKDAFVVEALNKGAAGYVTKGASPEELTFAISEVVKGKRYLCSSISERAIQAYLNNDIKASTDSRLTPREVEIVKLTAEGLSAAEIGVRLGISARTVENHRGSAMTKLGLRNQAELVRYALTDLVIPTLR